MTAETPRQSRVSLTGIHRERDAQVSLLVGVLEHIESRVLGRPTQKFAVDPHPGRQPVGKEMYHGGARNVARWNQFGPQRAHRSQDSGPPAFLFPIVEREREDQIHRFRRQPIERTQFFFGHHTNKKEKRGHEWEENYNVEEKIKEMNENE